MSITMRLESRKIDDNGVAAGKPALWYIENSSPKHDTEAFLALGDGHYVYLTDDSVRQLVVGLQKYLNEKHGDALPDAPPPPPDVPVLEPINPYSESPGTFAIKYTDLCNKQQVRYIDEVRVDGDLFIGLRSGIRIVQLPTKQLIVPA